MEHLIRRINSAKTAVNDLGMIYGTNISTSGQHPENTSHTTYSTKASETPISNLIRYGKVAIFDRLLTLGYNQPLNEEFTEKRNTKFKEVQRETNGELQGLEKKLLVDFDTIVANNVSRDYHSEIQHLLTQFPENYERLQAPSGDGTYSTVINYYRLLEIRGEQLQFEIERPRTLPMIRDELVSIKGMVQSRINNIRKYVHNLESSTIGKPAPAYDVREDFKHLGGR